MKKIYALFLLANAFQLAQAQFVDVWFQTDMSLEFVDQSGVHLANSFQNWDPDANPCMDMGNGIWGTMIQMLQGETIQYKFINGDAWNEDVECLTTDDCSDCGVFIEPNGYHREFTAPKDVTASNAPVYFYNTCFESPTNVENSNSTLKSIAIAPNPFNSNTVIYIDNPNRKEHTITIISLSGKNVGSIVTTKESNIELNPGQLLPGFYIMTLSNLQGESVTKKLIAH